MSVRIGAKDLKVIGNEEVENPFSQKNTFYRSINLGYFLVGAKKRVPQTLSLNYFGK